MRTTLVVLFFVNVIQKRAIVTKCKVDFKIGSNPRTMPLCYAMLYWAGRKVMQFFKLKFVNYSTGDI